MPGREIQALEDVPPAESPGRRGAQGGKQIRFVFILPHYGSFA